MNNKLFISSPMLSTFRLSTNHYHC